MCMAPPRIAGEWQLVEAGAIWKQAQAGGLFPIAFGISAKNIPEPLQGFQVTEFTFEDFARLAHALARLGAPQADVDADISARVKAAWPGFEQAVRAALALPDEAVHTATGFVYEVCGGWWERVHSAHGSTKLTWMWFERSAIGGLEIWGHGFDDQGGNVSKWDTKLVAVEASGPEPLVTYYWEGRHPNEEPNLLFGGKCWLRFSIDADGRVLRGRGEFADQCLNPREARSAKVHIRAKPTVEFDACLAPTVKVVDLLRATPDEVATMRGTDAAARSGLALGKLARWDA